jgi:hypothetical protein
MTRQQMENIIREYISSRISRLEEYSNIEICSIAEQKDAIRIMNARINALSDSFLEKFCLAIHNGCVTYELYGCS